MRSRIILCFISLVPQFSLQLAVTGQDVAGTLRPRGFGSEVSFVQVAGRQQQKQQSKPAESTGSCGKCSKRKCRPTHFRNPDTCVCTKCPNGQSANAAGNGCINGDKKCPTGQKANPAGDGCAKEETKCPAGQKPNKKEDDKKAKDSKARQEKKDKLIKNTVERKKKEYKKRKDDEEKKKKEDEKKAEEEKKRQFTEKKRTRIGKCLLLVPQSNYGNIDGISPFAYATEFFSEDFVSSDNVDELWPSDMADVPDADLDNGEYIESFVTIAAQIEDDKDTRWKPNHADWNPIGLKREETGSQAGSLGGNNVATEAIPTTSALTVTPSQHDKRNPFANAGTKGLDAMKKGSKAISKDKNWKNCLEGKKAIK
ncbi:uncharacterized protein PG998_003875 [Apiospora kogelbergensis]|uniref:uncharacterized protein n=1 Tax=Apiospora kogelbergensis TaxID=1337665 RepID=UPI003131167B